MADNNKPVPTANESGKKVHEPLFHITKKAAIPWQKAWAVRIGAVVAALVVCALVTMLLVHKDPIKIYGALRETINIKHENHKKGDAK